MLLMTSRLPFAEDLNVHENMGFRILKYIVQKCVGTGMTHIKLNCVFIYPKPLAPPPPPPASVRGKAFWTAGQQSLRYPKAPHQTEILQPLQKSLWLASSETIAVLSQPNLHIQ